MGGKWGEDMPETRKRELTETLRSWKAEADHGKRRGPFDGQELTGAEVYWLAEQVRIKSIWVPDLHLEGATLKLAQLQGAHLGQAHLEGADLRAANPEGAYLGAAQLPGGQPSPGTATGGELQRGAATGGQARPRHPRRPDPAPNVTLGDPRSAFARLLRRKPKWGNAALGNIRWEGPPDLTQVRWESLQRLGGEDGIGWRAPAIGPFGGERDHRAAVRA
jgi:hypothetical protein